MSARLLAILSVALLLAGCEIPGVYPDPKVMAREADAKATGGGCRHALRSLEDCYTLNPKAPRAAIFAGWREMDQYMRENKIEGVQAVIPSPKAETTEESVASSPEGKAERRGARGS
ncbi:hypothetical protein [Pseudorhodoferax sp. Leaf274]|uniref:hypothetical protein n=1 Tax=Pseudorhodoferax sp. Leaf274 TaxID=1736318 RepID=UPI0007026C32|nr:hypothetical protein [Pseudorhodoferax sp. Leaf274]KQP35726.1 hypothetical protein ASF44_20645 [Pseudorhodoferax sp. Leaf274]